MKKRVKRVKKRRTKKQARIRRLVRNIVILAVAVAAFLFVFIFKLDSVVVSGNSRYTESEIKELCIDENGFNNTIIYYLLHRRIRTDDIPLLEYIETEYVDNHTVMLKAHEKLTVGMFQVGEAIYCIDQDGIVVEQLDSESADQLDLPMISGLADQGMVGEKISADDSVINTLHALKSSFDKYSISPGSIDIQKDEESDSNTFILHFENVAVNMGADDLLEEKMRRVAAILPQLKGQSGTLHMEDYNEDVENIIFEQS